jgi:hypothetical protein
MITIDKDYTTKELHNLNGSLNGSFYISILAHDSAHIIFSQEENFGSGYMAALGGWANSTYSRSIIRYCNNIPTDDFPTDCTIHSKKVIDVKSFIS